MARRRKLRYHRRAESGYDATRSSKSRGEPLYPELDTRLDLSPDSRLELIRLSRWLVANTGLFTRIVDIGSDLVVGKNGLQFRAASSDRNWNELATDYFRTRAASPLTWDVEGRQNFRGHQLQNMRGKLRDGERFSIKTEDEAQRALFQMLPTERCVSPDHLDDFYETGGSRWRDGVLVSRLGRPQLFGFSDKVDSVGRNRTTWYRRPSFCGRNRVVRRIPAGNVLHFANLEEPGRVRGLPCFHGVINDGLDRAEINAFIKHGIKATNYIGYQVTTSGTPVSVHGEELTGGRKSRSPGAEGDAKGSDTAEDIPLDKVHGSGVAVGLPQGAKIATVGDDRPHQEYMQLDDRRVREICLASGLPPEIVWEITGAGGANMRWLQDSTLLWADGRRQEMIDSYCGPAALYTIARGWLAGDLPAPPADWYRHVWITPRKVGVDFGRDGRQSLAELALGVQTMEALYGCLGKEWKPEVDQWAEEWGYQTQAAVRAADAHDVTLDQMLLIRS